MKILKLIIILVLIQSCKTYTDSNNRVENIYKGLQLEYGKNYNILTVTHRTPFSMDTEVHSFQTFKTNIPKKLISWDITDGMYFFEYNDNQILVIVSNTADYNVTSDWKALQASEDQIHSYLYDYLYEKGLNPDDITTKSSRKSILYTDDKTEILLFNMKRQELKECLEILKDFTYVNEVNYD